MNINMPGSGQHRSYSFSSAPGSARMCFFIKQVPAGLKSTWLGHAQASQALQMTGPLSSLHLRPVSRPLLMLAGGTGLAPFLSMLGVLASQELTQPVQLIYGVTRDQHLVMVDRLEDYAARTPGFGFTTWVADPSTAHQRRGYVTQHMPPEVLHGGNVDVYLRGPPPMVDAVQKHFTVAAIPPAHFHSAKICAIRHGCGTSNTVGDFVMSDHPTSTPTAVRRRPPDDGSDPSAGENPRRRCCLEQRPNATQGA